MLDKLKENYKQIKYRVFLTNRFEKITKRWLDVREKISDDRAIIWNHPTNSIKTIGWLDLLEQVIIDVDTECSMAFELYASIIEMVELFPKSDECFPCL